MAYVPRVEAPDNFFHVGARGNNKRQIFLDDDDRNRFLLLLAKVAKRYAWSIYAYCLMGNHYHLVLRLSDAGLSRGMCELNTAYAVGFNARHQRINHLFGRRFWSEHINTEAYLLEAIRYVVQNPVRAGFCDSCEDWPWSSYRATIRLEKPEPFLAVHDVLNFVAPSAADPCGRFRDYCGIIVPKREARSTNGVWQPLAPNRRGSAKTLIT
jgi:REP element-mobilizing transposase RayT